MIANYWYKDRCWTIEERDAVYAKDPRDGKHKVGGYNHSRAWTAMLKAADANTR